MIRLFTTSFDERNPNRRAEYAEALARNRESGAFGEICIFAEGETSQDIRDVRVVTRSIQGRPRYDDYFAWINEVAAPADISLIANADIYFDEAITVLASTNLGSRTAIALARWDATEGGGFAVRNRNDSQDSWAFRGKVAGVDGSFHIGVPRCDNRIAHELERAGYEVINPAFSIPSYHLHAGVRDDYSHGHRDGWVEGPYKYIWPHNYMPPHRALMHNFRHRHAQISWKLDTRKLKATLKLHRIGKAWAIATGRSQPHDSA